MLQIMVESERPEDNIIRHMRVTCCITKATDMQSEVVHATILVVENQSVIVFHCKKGCTNAPQCSVVSTLSVLFYVMRHLHFILYKNYPNSLILFS
jgi:hypothetical protein